MRNSSARIDAPDGLARQRVAWYRTVPGGVKAASVLVVIAAVLGLWRVSALATSVQGVNITMSSAVSAFTPRLVLAQPNQPVVFTNQTGQTVELTSTPHTPQTLHFSVPSGGTVSFNLSTPGVYHLYDATTARVVDYVAANDVVQARPGAPNVNLPSQGWIIVPGPKGVQSNSYIDVPNSNDMLAPRALAVRVGGSVIIHNHDTDPHNLVSDPADPAGVAFELLGTVGEPAIHGAERRVTFTAPGLYHLYCSIHAMVMGEAGGWQVVMPRDMQATGYAEHNPMEAWIEVVQ